MFCRSVFQSLTLISIGAALAGCSPRIFGLDALVAESSFRSEIQFSRGFYTSLEDGTLIGEPITLVRSAVGQVARVTLESYSVTAMDGVNFSAGSIQVSFLPEESEKTIDLSSFGILVDPTRTGDLWFGLRATVDAGGNLGQINIAQVNIIDSETQGDFLLGQALYSVLESEDQVELFVQRVGSVAASASVDVEFVNASAVSGTDFTGATQTVNFLIGEREKSIEVPISDRAGVAANRSFFARLVNFSTATRSRPQGVAKVRILNRLQSEGCDSANDSLLLHDGFGGGTGVLGDPYLVCSLSQFFRIRTQNTAYFKMMRDIDADPAFDSDPSIVGVQPLVPTDTFGGSFDGNEYALLNYRHDAASGDHGLFGDWSSSSNGLHKLESLNVLHARVTNVATGGVLILKNGDATAWPVAIENSMVSGYLQVELGAMFQDAVEYGAGDSAILSFRNNFSAGLVQGWGTPIIAGLLGRRVEAVSSSNPVMTVETLYNTANLIFDDGASAGGILRDYHSTGVATGTFSMSDVENRGHLISTGSASSYSAGILGTIQASGIPLIIVRAKNYGDLNAPAGILGHSPGPLATISYSINYGNITSSSGAGGIGDQLPSVDFSYNENHGEIVGVGSATRGVGGILGGHQNGGTWTLDSNTNTGPVFGTQNTGGILGLLPVGTILTVENNISSGDVEGTTGVGGVLGGTPVTAGVTLPRTHLFQGNVVSSGTAVTATAGIAGGIIGRYRLQDAKTVQIIGDQFLGTVQGTTNTGGILGSLTSDTTDAGTGSVTITGVDVNGSIQGGNGTGGVVGQAVLFPPQYTLVIGDATTAGSVQAVNYAGGIIGGASVRATNGADASRVTISGCSTSAVISASTAVAGGIFGYLNTTGSTADVLSLEVLESYTTSAATVSAPTQVGGLLGYANQVRGSTQLSDNYSQAVNIGSVTTDKVGGLVGDFNAGSLANVLTVLNSYTTSTLVAAPAALNVGGLLGAASGTVTVNTNVVLTGSLFKLDAKNLPDVGALAPQDHEATDGDLQLSATFSILGWDISGAPGTTWWNPGVNGVYPSLQ